MLIALGFIVSQQFKATKKTYEETLWLLNYAASHPDATIRYCASDMVLHSLSDASYLSEEWACSRMGGDYFLIDRSLNHLLPPQAETTINGPIFTVSKIKINFMASATEAKIGNNFINFQEAVPISTSIR